MNKGLLGITPGLPHAGRARYARAMVLFDQGLIGAAQLEAYRSAASDDVASPVHEFFDRGVPLPDDQFLAPEAAIRRLIVEIDHYLASLSGPGLAEVRAGLARFQNGPVRVRDPISDPISDLHLPVAVDLLRADYPALADAIAAAAPWLPWQRYAAYSADHIGTAFVEGHLYASILGEDASVPAADFDLGLFIIAPHLLYRDHNHAAPELYAPLTGPHGWRFGVDRPLIVTEAHVPIWNPPYRPHLTKVGAVPLLSIFCWASDVDSPAQVLKANDWPALEALRLG